MPRSQNEWRRTLRDVTGHDPSRRHWALEGPGRLVKVRDIRIINPDVPLLTVEGFFTQERVLLRKTLGEIESTLGLPVGELAKGAQVFALRRLPSRSEYEWLGYATHPGGEEFDPNRYDMEMLQQEWEIDVGQRSVDRFGRFDRDIGRDQYVWPKGRPVPQWNLLVPLPAVYVRDLLPGQRYQ